MLLSALHFNEERLCDPLYSDLCLVVWNRTLVDYLDGFDYLENDDVFNLKIFLVDGNIPCREKESC